uniref:Uncharacterized protein n=1 Tax=Romanomermis culicivorax TaxID=13658 RepID=A0A915KDW1_ROMCU
MNSEVVKHFRDSEQANQVQQHLQDYKSMKSALRGSSRKGRIPVEDVYDLPMEYQCKVGGLQGVDDAEFLGPKARDPLQYERPHVGRDRRLPLVVRCAKMATETLVKREQGVGGADMDGHRYMNAVRPKKLIKTISCSVRGKKESTDRSTGSG